MAAVLEPMARPVIYGVLGGAFVLILIAALVIMNVLNRRRPRTFEVQAGDVWVSDLWAGDVWAGDVHAGERAFATPRLGAGVLIGLCIAPLGALGATVCGLEIAAGRHLVEAWLGLAGALVFYSAATWAAWNPTGVRLTPDAIIADRTGGTVVFPWAAIDPASPVVSGYAFPLRLVLAKPEMVTRSGLVTGFNKIAFDAVDPVFVAEVITHYAAEPERRAAIGTAAELDRLRAAFPPMDLETQAALTPRITLAGVIVRLLLVAAAIALLGLDHFWLESLGQLMIYIVIFSLTGQQARFRLWHRRRRAT
jgi:hypothetical protein